MKKFLNLLAIITLMTWGILFLYYYTSGRIEKYLDPDFRIYALLSGIGFILLAAFNFINRNQETGVCTHDHPHGETCDHDHHDHDHHDHDHAHDQDCGHDHGHGHDCGSDHSHGHDHDHPHPGHRAAAPLPVAAIHHDHEETASGMAFSLLILLVPILVATGYSQDKFSGEYLAKWGKIERQMMQMRIAQNRASEAARNEVGSVSNPYTRESIEQSGSYPGAPDTPPDPRSRNRKGGQANRGEPSRSRI